jgi:hypothetical protein
MKKLFYVLFAFVAIVFIACNNPKKNAKENPYEGAWEITYSKFASPDTTFEITKRTNPSVKILTEKHFAFGRQSGENKITGAGGEYIFSGDTYKESVKYHSNSSFVGQSVKYNQ